LKKGTGVTPVSRKWRTKRGALGDEGKFRFQETQVQTGTAPRERAHRG